MTLKLLNDHFFSKEQQKRLNLMKSKGVDTSLTILPVRLMGEPEGRISEIVGALLEQQGLKNIEHCMPK